MTASGMPHSRPSPSKKLQRLGLLLECWALTRCAVHGRNANLNITAQVTPARRVLHRSYVVGLMARALAQGGIRRSLTQVEWDVSAGCESPFVVELEGREDAPARYVNPDPYDPHVEDIVWFRDQFWFKEYVPTSWPLSLVIETKCRKCPTCLRHRAAQWRIRAEAEINAAPRTWFGTLTLRPEEQFKARCRAEQRLANGGTVFTKLSASEQFREVHREIGRDLTLWLKRIRKESGATLRYCLVAEAHKSGLPHYHCLIHEVNGSASVKERTLRLQWNAGFSKFNLVQNKVAARYVCKYLSKSSLARVRASIDYGNTTCVIASRDRN